MTSILEVLIEILKVIGLFTFILISCFVIVWLRNKVNGRHNH